MTVSTTPQLTARPVLEFTSAEVAEAMNRSFEAYFVPMHFDAASFERRFRGEHLDPSASCLWFWGEQLVGVVFIARRGWQSRVAAMGLVQEFRLQGLGKTMLQTALDEARQRGDQSMLLEVFTVNAPAIRLYERLGFQITRTITGFQQPDLDANTQPDALTPCDPLTVARLVIAAGDADLPWMLAGETLLATTAPHGQAWELEGKAYALLRVEPQRLLLMSLVVKPEYRRQGWGTRMVHALAATYAPRTITMPPLLPAGPGAALLAKCGWQPATLELYEMTCQLESLSGITPR